ncbi:hypothetical protein [Noviherbaspirillum saxi]|uniref:Uncharacterized protein n=1 Tax=Noviherbaspirillum saxi TaxID=2320863 RepID=A0A3A3FHQ6_9BURK|nr:hypothetical protein [Noviherbaspirillum saxi]RJF95038.1 hypothetical protein D3871_16355 [Noviherbaspirillum saxi]
MARNQQSANQGNSKHSGRRTLPTELDDTMQSDHSLSQSDEDYEDEGFSVAEEQNFDQQSDQASSVGRMPPDIDVAGATAEENPSDAMADSIRSGAPDGGNPNEKKADLKQSIERAVPPSV